MDRGRPTDRPEPGRPRPPVSRAPECCQLSWELSSLGIGGALGLPAAALMAQNFDWHVLFHASAALAALALVLIARYVP
ncbi:hypothetical protein, partial [Streptomyces sp. NPDC057509]|uniref:hypothetical protein n=1 Tax=Streptomyces sp. NPDC057509 TaxID=3346152 RepID=UPI00368E8752